MINFYLNSSSFPSLPQSGVFSQILEIVFIAFQEKKNDREVIAGNPLIFPPTAEQRAKLSSAAADEQDRGLEEADGPAAP